MKLFKVCKVSPQIKAKGVKVHQMFKVMHTLYIKKGKHHECRKKDVDIIRRSKIAYV